MTIQEAHGLINSGEVEATHCGLASNFACWFIHEGTRYMLSEIKGHYIRLYQISRAPNTVLHEISLKGA